VRYVENKGSTEKGEDVKEVHEAQGSTEVRGAQGSTEEGEDVFR
jgi:hypothetical protein